MNNINIIEKQLREETEKWLLKAKEKRREIKLVDESKENVIKNIDAYISDAQYFLDKGNLIRAFEAVIWAWSIIELGAELGVLGTL